MSWTTTLTKTLGKLTGKQKKGRRARPARRVRTPSTKTRTVPRRPRQPAQASLTVSVTEQALNHVPKSNGPQAVQTLDSAPAILGGPPAFKDKYFINKPILPDAEEIVPALKEIFASRQVTNGRHVRQFEAEAAKYVGAKHAIAVSSCSAGLMLAYRALNLAKGEVVLPSYTFTMSANAALWNGLTPVFCDCDPLTWNIDADKLQDRITDKTVAICATHLFGNPCDVRRIAELAKAHGLAVIYDSAHALGSTFAGARSGQWGDINVYSMSPTKIITTAGEGGLVTTNDDELAEKLRILRNYGVAPDYDCALLGFNCRMTEFQALVGLRLLPRADALTRRKNELVTLYKRELADLPGLRYQRIAEGAAPTYKDFNILIEDGFGLTRDQVGEALKAENIEVRYYYYPPIHAQTLYAPFADGPLPLTDYVTGRVVTLPLYPDMPEADVKTVAAVLRRLHGHRKAIAAKLASP